MLRTRSPVYSPLRAFSLDLHVLGTPPAFVLSQDQTLQLKFGVQLLAELTYFKYFTQSIAVSAICFVDLLSGFQRPSVTATADDQLPPPAVSGGVRFLPLSAARVKGLRFRPRPRPTAAGGASCNTAFRRCQEPAAPPLIARWNLGMERKIPRLDGGRGRRDTPPCCPVRRSPLGAPPSPRGRRGAPTGGTTRSRRP